MKAVTLTLALLTAATVTSAFAEGGADRLQARSAQWAMQRAQAEQAVANAQGAQQQRQADAQPSNDKPAS